MAGNSGDPSRTVTSKVIGILLLFAQGSDYSLSEIARLAGLPVSTAHRLVLPLVAAGILERNDDSRFQAGLHLRMIGKEAPPASPSIQEKIRRVVEDLAGAAVGMTVRMGVLRDREVYYIEKLPGSHPVARFCDCAVAPAHASAMGKVLLAFADRRLVDRVIGQGLDRYTGCTLTDPDQFRRGLALIRRTGVAVCRHEFDLAASAVAVPVVGAAQEVVAALEVATRDSRSLSPMLPALVVAARSLSRQILAAPDGRYLGVGVGRAAAA